jgi:altronate dehydratase
MKICLTIWTSIAVMLLARMCLLKKKGRQIFEQIIRPAEGTRSKSKPLGLGDHEFVPW